MTINLNFIQFFFFYTRVRLISWRFEHNEVSNEIASFFFYFIIIVNNRSREAACGYLWRRRLTLTSVEFFIQTFFERIFARTTNYTKLYSLKEYNLKGHLWDIEKQWVFLVRLVRASKRKKHPYEPKERSWSESSVERRLQEGSQLLGPCLFIFSSISYELNVESLRSG